MKFKNLSPKLNTLLSFVALYVKYILIGNIIRVDNQLASTGLILLSSAKFFEKIPKKWYAKNNWC